MRYMPNKTSLTGTGLLSFAAVLLTEVGCVGGVDIFFLFQKKIRESGW
jgi:hypothetical protein